MWYDFVNTNAIIITTQFYSPLYSVSMTTFVPPKSMALVA